MSAVCVMYQNDNSFILTFVIISPFMVLVVILYPYFPPGAAVV